MKSCASFLIALLLMAAPRLAHAQLTATLAASIQNSASGQTLLFSGTLVNTGTTQLFLNNLAFTLSGSSGVQLVSGSNAFYANVPGILPPSQSYNGPLFTIALGGTAPPADYTGSVSLQGGADIFAVSDLGDLAFTILSPAVIIVATTGTASEFGQVPGAFTISRTGGTDIGLPVAFGIGGSAVNGTDYQAIGTSTTISAGSSSTTVAITPILRQLAVGTRTVTLTASSSTLYDLGAHLSDTVTIQDTPYNYWRLENFGASANAPQTSATAEWTESGIPNLTAYSLNISPIAPDTTLLPSVSTSSNYLTLSYSPNPSATDITYTVQASTDLVNWSSANVQQISDSTPGQVSFQYTVPVSPTAPQAFLRLLLTPLD